MPSCHVPSTSLHKTTLPHLRCTSVICMRLTGEQNHAATGISDSPRNSGSRMAAGPTPPGTLQAPGIPFRAALHLTAPSIDATRLACRQHSQNANCTTEGGEGRMEGGGEGGGRKDVSADSSSVSLHAPLRQQIPCSVPSCRAVQQS